MSSLMQSSSTPNWLGSQGSSSGLIVKRTIRVDIPVDQYPSVQLLLLLVLSLFGLLPHIDMLIMADIAVQFCWAPPWP